jgi:hypothetical protein
MVLLLCRVRHFDAWPSLLFFSIPSPDAAGKRAGLGFLATPSHHVWANEPSLMFLFFLFVSAKTMDSFEV